MKTFKEAWIDGKLVRGEEGTAPAPMPTKADNFLNAAYGVGKSTNLDAEPQRGYHNTSIDRGALARRPHLWERGDATCTDIITPNSV